MNNYVTLGAIDESASNGFYDRVLATIGWSCHVAFPGWRGYSLAGAGEGLVLWICRPFDGASASGGNGTMIGFAARSVQEVHAFHAAALSSGGSDEGAPGARPDYGANWYAAYVRDPAGNKLAIVHNP